MEHPESIRRGNACAGRKVTQLARLLEGQRTASMVPNGQFQVVRNAGHYQQGDAGEEIAERMVTFLRDEAQVVST